MWGPARNVVSQELTGAAGSGRCLGTMGPGFLREGRELCSENLLELWEILGTTGVVRCLVGCFLDPWEPFSGLVSWELSVTSRASRHLVSWEPCYGSFLRPCKLLESLELAGAGVKRLGLEEACR